jgi:hypothetical protein
MEAQKSKLHKLLQYILSVASQNDPFEKELGPIHLIKYVYLADLDYARYHKGQTYTGLEWKFHNFGPWSFECFREIEPAFQSIEADRREIESQYSDDSVRWSVSDDYLHKSLTNEMNLTIMGSVQKNVRKFGTDTHNLLDYIYKTAPMINAAPDEIIDFKLAASFGASDEINEEKTPDSELTKRQKKKRQQKLTEFKQHLNERLEKKISADKGTTCQPSPRYDDIFFEGLKQLDEAAGTQPEGAEYVAYFEEDVWKSGVRNDPELP